MRLSQSEVKQYFAVQNLHASQNSTIIEMAISNLSKFKQIELMVSKIELSGKDYK